MGDNFDKTMAILNGDKAISSRALKAMAIDLDKKFEYLDKRFEDLEERNNERHEALMKAISQNKSDTDKKFDKIKIVMFFSENPKWLYLIIIGVVSMIFLTGFGDLIKLIK